MHAPSVGTRARRFLPQFPKRVVRTLDSPPWPRTSAEATPGIPVGGC
jgi:hypothetical protein